MCAAQVTGLAKASFGAIIISSCFRTWHLTWQSHHTAHVSKAASSCMLAAFGLLPWLMSCQVCAKSKVNASRSNQPTAGR